MIVKSKHFSKIVLLLFVMTLEIGSNINILNQITEKSPDKSSVYSDIRSAYSFTNETIFVLGRPYDITAIDPLNAWDSSSIEVIDQICEGLFSTNLSDPAHSIIPRLASDEGIWNGDGTIFNVTLMENIYFHDGTRFNATAVKWNFDRLKDMITNSSGLSEVYPLIASVYTPVNDTFVIQNITVVNETYISFKLNYPYSPFKGMLTFSGSYIISPHSTPLHRFLNASAESLVGTGPYCFTEFIDQESITFDYWPFYHRGIPGIKRMIWVVYDNVEDLNLSLINGTIDMVDSPSVDYFDVYNASSDITFQEGPESLVGQYLCMNNNYINQNFRKAISFGINYTEILNISNPPNSRLKSPLPSGLSGSNESFNYATMNITQARQIIIDMNMSSGLTQLSSDEEWQNLTETTPALTVNYTYNDGSYTRKTIGAIITDNLGYIGIKVNNVNLTWGEFAEYLYEINGHTKDELNLYVTGWGADYNDALAWLTPLFSNNSVSNLANINDPYLQSLLLNGTNEIDVLTLQTIVDEIQRYLVEDLMPVANLFSPKIFGAWSTNLSGFLLNSWGKQEFFACTWKNETVNIIDLNTNIFADPDNDAISSWDEYSIYFTNPYNEDTDSDGMPDAWELTYSLDPLDNGDGILDSDLDGLINAWEYGNSTIPDDSDSDDDGLSDNLELIMYLTNATNNDTDGDGLFDYNEIFLYSTNASDSDTDGDSISDFEELILYSTNASNNDTDGDGLFDYNEIFLYSTNASDSDSDGDSISDFDELMVYSTNASNDDSDGDNLSDFEELMVYSTNATSNDTDGDSLSDFDELLVYSTNATSNDTDGDGLSDFNELKLYFTNATSSDSDGDGLSDFDELMLHFTDAMNDDTDGDGISDSMELEFDSDPLNQSSIPHIESLLSITINSRIRPFGSCCISWDGPIMPVLDNLSIYLSSTKFTKDNIGSMEPYIIFTEEIPDNYTLSNLDDGTWYLLILVENQNITLASSIIEFAVENPFNSTIPIYQIFGVIAGILAILGVIEVFMKMRQHKRKDIDSLQH
ncbi:ABC transporter substrate-binding protein [Candidatus Lokiarchaeum ossiferum]|uniref:ABC transporter substrate-binding protein n=1 Tax=Candidatus Lokiarchaeum ossiferum TaxID=2951803 RepID=UPI00352E1B73